MTALATLAIAISLLAGPPAQAFEGDLPTRIASDFNGRQFHLLVNPDRGYELAGWTGRAFVGGLEDKIWLGPDALRDARKGGGRGLLVLMHEIGHTRGIADERQATCYALDEIRPVLARYYGVTGRKAILRYRAAVRFVSRIGGVYSHGACRREAWSES